MKVDENILVMRLTELRFRGFINGEILDAARTKEVLTRLLADSSEQVEETIQKAVVAGGKPRNPTMDRRPMYRGNFQDPDGHVCELTHMEP